MYIESPQNARVRAWSQLKSKKGRSRQGLFLVEGRRLIEELFRSAYEVDALLWNVASDELSDELRSHPKAAGNFFELSPAAFDQVCDTTTPQGVIAVAKLPQAKQARMSRHAVLLDGLQDPGNVGTLLRSAEAFAFSTVCCGSNTVDPFSPKVVRATMGGMFRLQLHTDDSLPFVREWRHQHPDGRVVVTAAEADAPCYDAELSQPTLVVIGSEAFGISDDVRNLADQSVSIPMSIDTESLNAAVAGSILLYEAYRQTSRRGDTV
ncbi:RNA methyltransferase [Alicyclobacillus fastidiosus]|uniref:RNA methyltransferase n=1 Tax=Alicyclobacillus fastidiosus TaxID=392011 RepID=A0ABY6ZKY1_9BACL|nr:RNA methyltransferase [Alicyclobacillus fastidiosus]WAH43588.1 RNA methyltransferase [Alicyclobacillus fastidiosus]GMA59770.1 rRNA methyltransferase [Alicyclobacillus fastidiosus]